MLHVTDVMARPWKEEEEGFADHTCKGTCTCSDDCDDDKALLLDAESGHRGMRVLRKWRKRFLRPPVIRFVGELCGEFIGTFFLVLIIITMNTTAVVLRAEVGLWQVAVVSGLGVGLSIYSTSHFSKSHFNPAVTLAFAVVRWRAFSWKKIVPYILVQVFAGFLAGAMLYAMYWKAIVLFERNNNITRGSDESVSSAMVFGEYFPNPGFDVFQNETADAVSPAKAMAIEAWATGILVFMIFSFSDPNNSSVGSSKSKVAIPVLIGLTVAVLISLYAPLTQAGLNPARDFGPRLFAAAAGWGRIAIPGPGNGFWVYIVGPLIGGPIGGAMYDWVVAWLILQQPKDVGKSM